MSWYEVTVGNGGWVRVNHPDLPGWLYLRFALDDRGRLRPVDQFIEGTDEPIAAAHLRAVPIAELEAWANGNGDHPMSVRASLSRPGPDMRTLAGAYNTTYSPSAADSWLKLEFVSRFPASELRSRGYEPPPLAWPPAKPREPVDPPAYNLDAERAAIRRPAGRALPDSFLADVAHAYSVLAKEGRKPAPVIAAEADVPVTTVHRWIKEARRRGLLAPARRGATG